MRKSSKELGPGQERKQNNLGLNLCSNDLITSSELRNIYEFKRKLLQKLATSVKHQETKAFGFLTTYILDMNLLTTKQAAQRLSMSADTLRRWEAEGRIKSERTEGGHRRFQEADVLNLEQEIKQGLHRERIVRKLPGKSSTEMVSLEMLQMAFRNTWPLLAFYWFIIIPIAVLANFYNGYDSELLLIIALPLLVIVVVQLIIIAPIPPTVRPEEFAPTPETTKAARRYNFVVRACHASSWLLCLVIFASYVVVSGQSSQTKENISRTAQTQLNAYITQESKTIQCIPVRKAFLEDTGKVQTELKSLQGDRFDAAAAPDLRLSSHLKSKFTGYFDKSTISKAKVHLTKAYNGKAEKLFTKYKALCP